MNSNLEKNQNVDHKMYETPNMGTILEPKVCEQNNNMQDIRCF
jgi:hypothetical protein